MSRTLLPFNFTLVGLTAALSTGVATMSSLAQLRVQDTEEWRQCRCGDARLTENRNAKSKQLLMLPTEQLTDWEWLPESPWVDGNVQRPGCFFFEVKYQTYSPRVRHVAQTHNEWEQNIPSTATDVHITIHSCMLNSVTMRGGYVGHWSQGQVKEWVQICYIETFPGWTGGVSQLPGDAMCCVWRTSYAGYYDWGCIVPSAAWCSRNVAEYTLASLPGLSFLSFNYLTHGRLVPRLLYTFHVCWFVCLCVRTYHMCNKCHVHCCHSTLLWSAWQLLWVLV